MGIFNYTTLSIAFGIILLSGCKKEELVRVENNTAPPYDGIPTVIVQNYVNRLFIDLLGREPLDVEMEAEVSELEANGLEVDARRALVNKLMYDTDYVEGDSSYNLAYFRRLYELQKARTLEAASDDQLEFYIGLEQQGATIDSLNGDSAGLADHRLAIQRLRDVLRSWRQMLNGEVQSDVMLSRMLQNQVYDQINMNSFNFINAAFDDLYQRYPTQAEFDQCYAMVEFNQPGILFGQSGQSKADVVAIMTGVPEFYEGMVRWCYNTFLAREPSTYEVYNVMNTFWNDHNLQDVQREVLVTDEYANFE